MKRFLFGSEVHDKACCAILRESPMGENIRLSFRREPSFFPAEKIANTWSQLVVLQDDENEKVFGFGVRSGRPYWLNGQKVELGYKFLSIALSLSLSLSLSNTIDVRERERERERRKKRM